ncbi:MAG: hypothetical protein V1733_07440 [bacterium]
MGLITEYPFWFIGFCLLLGAFYSFILYVRTDKETLPSWMLWLLAGFRFLSIFLISFLLLAPLIRQKINSVEKPVIIIGQDNSESVILTRDSAFYRKTYPEEIRIFAEKLKKKYEVSEYTFGNRLTEGLETNFSNTMTDISSFFSEISSRYYNRNVGAVILASDGIYNYGTDPFYTCRDLPFTIYTVAMGDTSDVRDLYIRECHYNRQIFVGDHFPVQVQIGANHCSGEMINAVIRKDDKIIQSRILPVEGSRFTTEVNFLLDAGEKGWHKYVVELSPLNKEVSQVNNRLEIFIEVQDIRTRILLLCDAPHPDIGSIRQALEKLNKYELIERRTDEFLVSPDTADLVILYQVPSIYGPRIPEEVVSKFPATLFVLGSQSDFPAFNRLKTGMLLSSSQFSFSESYPVLNETFSLFTIDPSDKKVFAEFTPLQSPFAAYESAPLTDVLFYQKIGNVTSRFPLICFTQDAQFKKGYIFGENFWRWRLSDYMQTHTHTSFDLLLQKIVQYLSIQTDRSFFRIKHKAQLTENEPVEFEAELYNKSYELINNREITLIIKDENGNKYPFSFAPTGNSYYLNAGSFQPGVYTYEAGVAADNTRYEKSGLFVITPLNLEAVDLKADHQLLFRIASAHGGRMYFPLQLDMLAEDLVNSGEIHSIAFQQQIFSDMIGNIWLFILIVGLLSAEWFIRKFSGL